MKNNTALFVFLFLSLAPPSNALDIVGFWRHSEIAEKNSVFIDLGIPVQFAAPYARPLPVNVRVDYMPPLPLPFSAGIFFDTPYPNLRSFGVRAGYHLNIFDPLTDIYAVHSFNCGFLITRKLYEYNDRPPPVRLFDFRLGVRHFFSQIFGVSVETGYKLENVFISLSLKLN